MINVVCDPGSRYTKLAVSRDDKFQPVCVHYPSYQADDMGRLATRAARVLKPGLFEPVRLWVAGDGWVPKSGRARPVLLGSSLARAAGVLGDSVLVADCGGLRTRVFEVSGGVLKRTLENERCTSGGGRFVETMASALGLGLDRIDDVVAGSFRPIHVSSPCMVFAESEMISQVNSGIAPADVMAGVVSHAVEKVATLVQQAGVSGRPVVLTGGLAGLSSFQSRLASALPGVPVFRPSGNPIFFNSIAALAVVCSADVPGEFDKIGTTGEHNGQ